MPDVKNNKGMSYFGRDAKTGELRSWNRHITRDERFFCAHLYWRILERGQAGIQDFVKMVNETCKFDPPLTVDTYWELGYEVCFYRDIWFDKGKQEAPASFKRTFDLCLFSEEAIVVIEAKAYEGFKTNQLNSFKDEQQQIAEQVSGISPEQVHIIGLTSSRYTPSEKTKADYLKSRPFLTWKDLAAQFKGDDILARADAIYQAASPS